MLKLSVGNSSKLRGFAVAAVGAAILGVVWPVVGAASPSHAKAVAADSATFTDPTGDSADGPDVTTVDVSDEDPLTSAIDELARELGPLSVAYANAGVLVHAASITDLDLDEWNRVLSVDLTGVMLTFRAAIPRNASNNPSRVKA